MPPGHLGSLHFFSGPTPFITKSLLKSRVANLQPTKMSQYRLGNPDAHVPPSLNKGARPQKHVIVSSYLGSGGPKVISSFWMFLYQILRLVHLCILTSHPYKIQSIQESAPHALQNWSKECKIAPHCKIQNYFLQVIPTSWHIIWNAFWHSISHSIWPSLWHLILTYIEAQSLWKLKRTVFSGK